MNRPVLEAKARKLLLKAYGLKARKPIPPYRHSLLHLLTLGIHDENGDLGVGPNQLAEENNKVWIGMLNNDRNQDLMMKEAVKLFRAESLTFPQSQEELESETPGIVEQILDAMGLLQRQS